jgi:hypothetical protein
MDANDRRNQEERRYQHRTDQSPQNDFAIDTFHWFCPDLLGTKWILPLKIA